MKILILEDEQRNAMRLIRLLNDIDTTFIIEGPYSPPHTMNMRYRLSSSIALTIF